MTNGALWWEDWLCPEISAEEARCHRAQRPGGPDSTEVHVGLREGKGSGLGSDSALLQVAHPSPAQLHTCPPPGELVISCCRWLRLPAGPPGHVQLDAAGHWPSGEEAEKNQRARG